MQTYPFLRDYLKSLGRANIKDSTLAKRLLKLQREGGIPQGLVNAHGASIVQNNNHPICSNIVSHHNLVNPDRKLPFLDFMALVKPKVLPFFAENLLNNVQLILNCQMLDKDGTPLGLSTLGHNSTLCLNRQAWIVLTTLR